MSMAQPDRLQELLNRANSEDLDDAATQALIDQMNAEVRANYSKYRGFGTFDNLSQGEQKFVEGALKHQESKDQPLK
jgi:hypothetical protein